MRIVLQFGARMGTVADFPPREARAMLADGRARPVEDAPTVVSVKVEARQDRGMPTGKRRSTR